MDQSGAPQLEGIGVTTKKRRSQTSRRPRPEAHSLPDQSPKSSTPVSDDMSIASIASSDENAEGSNSGLKMFNLNQCVSRSLPVGGADSRSNTILSNGKSEGAGSENAPKKVKLKVGGVTCTIQTKSSSTGPSGSGSLESSDEYHPHPDKKSASLQGFPWMDSSSGSYSIGRENMGRTSTRNACEKQEEKSDSFRKSKRLPKKRVLDGEFDDDGEDDEIRYLEKLKTSKAAGYKDLESQSTRKQKGVKYNNVENVRKPRRDARKSRSGDMDYGVEEELLSDDELEGLKSKKLNKDMSELSTETKRGMALTTRQRALLTKDAPATGSRQIEFPDGLPPAPPRKQKEKLSEVEQQLKKAEAAERRRIQSEKAARESEAEAIRRILGQDSSRKKREEKMKKRQEELAKEKAANAQMLASNTIRTVMGPSGTIVTFPQEIGFPKIFDSKPYSYPPPREKCAGPFCTNAYLYRDSKSKLPLCSLQCYKAISEKIQTEVC